MEINKEAIDIHYHYDVVRMVASQGCKFVTKVRREDFEYYNFTDEEWICNILQRPQCSWLLLHEIGNCSKIFNR